LQESCITAAGIKRPDEPPLIHYARGVQTKILPLERV
jgi:hypothetical protein